MKFIKKHITILLLLTAFGLSAQDKLNAETASASDKRSGRNASFKNLARARIDVSGVNAVMVLSSFDTRFDRGTDAREGLYKLTDGSSESQVIQQSLNSSGGMEIGIGTLVYIFDASAQSGQVNYILQHSSNSRLLVKSSGTVVAIPLTTSASGVDLPHDLKSISSAVYTSATLNEWTPVSGLSTKGIQLASDGNVYVSASINCFANGSGIGEWILQYSSDQSIWIDIGSATSRSLTAARQYATASLSWIMENLVAGTHYFRIAHRQTQGSEGDVRTLNSNLIACGLIYEAIPGTTRKFPSFVHQKPSSSTSLTSMSPAISFSIDPANETDLFFQAQYVASADDDTDAAAYDLSIDQGILDGVDQSQHIPSATFTGGGGSVGFGSSLQVGTPYGISLRHQTAFGTTLTTQNITLAGFQLSSTGNSVWQGGGTSPTTWENIDNWIGEVPGERDNAIIPGNLTYYPLLTTYTSCEDLQIESGASLMLEAASSMTVHGQLVNDGTLEIHSDGTGTGSLIVGGQASGQVSYQSYLTADQWHIFSPPLSGQSITSFLGNDLNQISYSDQHGVYGFTDYNELTNSWNGFFSNSTGGDLMSGKAYLMRRDDPDGTVTSTGELVDSDLLLGVTANGNGWNAVGNPFTSAIGVTSDATTATNFLTANLDQLDPNYSVLYLWDEVEGYNGTQNNYKVIGNSGYIDLKSYPELDMDYLQAGQGFLIKSAEGGGSLLFSKKIQTHQNGIPVLKSTQESWDGFKLVALNGDRRESTTICFHQEMSLGLDPSYDAGLLNSKPEFSIYTRLLEEDQGINFKIQCLPDQVKNEVEIPVGMDLEAGGEVTFFTEGVILPEQHQIFLEDRMLGVMTDISSRESSYEILVQEGAVGTERFFLHLRNTTSSRSDNEQFQDPGYYAYYHQQFFTIMGMVEEGALALLYDMGGRNVGTYKLQKGDRHQLPVSMLRNGLYLITVIDGAKRYTLKIVKNEP